MFADQMQASDRGEADNDEPARCRICFELGALEDAKEVLLDLGAFIFVNAASVTSPVPCIIAALPLPCMCRSGTACICPCIRYDSGPTLRKHTRARYAMRRIDSKTKCGRVLQDGELIEPCACKGTQRYVHKSCLVRWQARFFFVGRSPPFFCLRGEREKERERERERGREGEGDGERVCVCTCANEGRTRCARLRDGVQ